MKVLFINTLYAPHIGGGAERILQVLVEGLATRGVEVVVLATSNQPGLHQDEVNGIRVWRAGSRNLYWHFRHDRPSLIKRRAWHALDIYNPRMAAYVRRVTEVERPDVASCHNLPGWTVATWMVLAALRVPIVQVLHDYYLLCPKATMFKSGHNCETRCAACRLMRVPHRSLSRRVTGVVGVSSFILDRYRAMGYFEGSPVQRVIYNARSTKALELNMMSSSPRAVTDPLRFGFIGTLVPNKGIELLLDTFARQPPDGTELWVAGAGYADYEAALRRRFEGSKVRFLGQIEPNRFYSEVDVVVVPSLWNDTLPGVVFEALAVGRPVIGARRGGIPEMVQDGVNGILFEPDRPQDLAEAMRRIAGDHGQRVRMGEAARSSVALFTDVNRFVTEHEKVCETICTRGNQGSLVLPGE